MRYQFAAIFLCGQLLALANDFSLLSLANSGDITPSGLDPRWARSKVISEVVEFPELGLAIPKPNGFVKATSFYGFQQVASSSSIVLTRIPGPWAEVTQGFDRARLATRGMTLLSKQAIKIENQPGLLLQLEQSAYGQKFQKWVVVFGDEGKTNIVTATYLKKNAAKLSTPLKTAVLAVSNISTNQPVKSSLPFSIQATEGLALVQKATGLGKVAAFTKDGQIPLASPDDPLFLVAPSLGTVTISDRKSFATRRLQNYPQTEITSIQATNEIAIDNIPGWEIEATGQDRQTKTPLRLYQIMLFPQQAGYVLLTGVVGDKQAEIYLPKFRAMAQTYKKSPQ